MIHINWSVTNLERGEERGEGRRKEEGRGGEGGGERGGQRRGERRRKTNCKFMQSRQRERERREPSVSSYFDAGKTEGRRGAIKKENGQIHPGRFSNRWIPYSFCSFSLILPRSSLSNLEIFSTSLLFPPLFFAFSFRPLFFALPQGTSKEETVQISPRLLSVRA